MLSTNCTGLWSMEAGKMIKHFTVKIEFHLAWFHPRGTFTQLYYRLSPIEYREIC